MGKRVEGEGWEGEGRGIEVDERLGRKEKWKEVEGRCGEKEVKGRGDRKE